MTAVDPGTATERFVAIGPGGERPAMQPHECPGCGNRVLVRKNAMSQTAVQWLESTKCLEFMRSESLTARALVPSCKLLNDSIDEAVKAGRIEIPAP